MTATFVELGFGLRAARGGGTFVRHIEEDVSLFLPARNSPLRLRLRGWMTKVAACLRRCWYFPADADGCLEHAECCCQLDQAC